MSSASVLFLGSLPERWCEHSVGGLSSIELLALWLSRGFISHCRHSVVLHEGVFLLALLERSLDVSHLLHHILDFLWKINLAEEIIEVVSFANHIGLEVKTLSIDVLVHDDLGVGWCLPCALEYLRWKRLGIGHGVACASSNGSLAPGALMIGIAAELIVVGYSTLGSGHTHIKTKVSKSGEAMVATMSGSKASTVRSSGVAGSGLVLIRVCHLLEEALEGSRLLSGDDVEDKEGEEGEEGPAEHALGDLGLLLGGSSPAELAGDEDEEGDSHGEEAHVLEEVVELELVS